MAKKQRYFKYLKTAMGTAYRGEFASTGWNLNTPGQVRWFYQWFWRTRQ